MYYSTRSKEWFYNEEAAKEAEKTTSSKSVSEFNDLLDDFDNLRKEYLEDKENLRYKYEDELKRSLQEISEFTKVS